MIKAKYTQSLQVSETQETRDRINAIADAEGISQAEVVRDIIAAGLPQRERLSQERVGVARGT